MRSSCRQEKIGPPALKSTMPFLFLIVQDRQRISDLMRIGWQHGNKSG